jgi:hypothetical protein
MRAPRYSEENTAKINITNKTPEEVEKQLARDVYEEVEGKRRSPIPKNRHPNLARAHHQELAAGKFSGVFMECLVEVLDLGVQGGPRQPEEEDAGMGEALVENQLPEIAIGNDQDPLLLPGDRKHVLIGKAGREIAGNG